MSSLFLGCGLYCSLGIMPRLSGAAAEKIEIDKHMSARILELKAEGRALDAAEFAASQDAPVKPRKAKDSKEKTGTNRSQASTGEERRTVEDLSEREVGRLHRTRRAKLKKESCALDAADFATTSQGASVKPRHDVLLRRRSSSAEKRSQACKGEEGTVEDLSEGELERLQRMRQKKQCQLLKDLKDLQDLQWRIRLREGQQHDRKRLGKPRRCCKASPPKKKIKLTSSWRMWCVLSKARECNFLSTTS